MEINRDNYEEYFLLYADNELTDSEKAAVLIFVKNNKDLENEFRLIHHTIAKPDTKVHLADKSFLFKNEAATFINENNYEEFFVLYHDNELSEKERLEVENFLLLHEELKNDFGLIGLTKLTAESAVMFPGKNLLYKKEKATKVIPLYWRLAAAAVFIGFGIWGVNLYFKNSNESVRTTATIKSTNSLPATKAITSLPKKGDSTLHRLLHHNDSSSSLAINYKEKNQKVLKETNINNALTIVNKNNRPELKKLRDNIPERESNKDLVFENEKVNTAQEQLVATNTIEPSKKLPQDVVQNIHKEELPAYIQTASYIVNDNNKNQNYIFYDITTEKFKQTKVGGFLKKVKRVIERNNPISRLLSPDEKQVASN